MDSELTKTPEELAKYYGGASRLFLAIIRNQHEELKTLRKQSATLQKQNDWLCDMLAKEWDINES